MEAWDYNLFVDNNAYVLKSSIGQITLIVATTVQVYFLKKCFDVNAGCVVFDSSTDLYLCVSNKNENICTESYLQFYSKIWFKTVVLWKIGTYNWCL